MHTAAVTHGKGNLSTAHGRVVGDQGTLGQQISSAAKLVDLQAKQNRFSALGLTFLEAPSRLPPGLTFCDISDNQLRGTVPEGLVRHPNLIVLRASHNSFSVRLRAPFSSGAWVVDAGLRSGNNIKVLADAVCIASLKPSCIVISCEWTFVSSSPTVALMM